VKIIDACVYLLENQENDMAAMLAQMDQLGIDCAVIHPCDRYFAYENESGNEIILAISHKYPGRFIPAVTVNPWRKDASAVLMRYFDQGAKIIAFSPGVQGFNVCENLLDEILEKLSELKPNPPVYVHTGHHSFGAPSQLAMLAKRFHGLSFIMGHAGATDYGTDVVPICQMCENIFIESSFARPPGFIFKASQIGFSRAIYGSGFPLNTLSFELAEMKRLLPLEKQEDVLGKNLLRLLGEA
jgi:predicted TIM-barrel fold metal-dependent hydrolase